MTAVSYYPGCSLHASARDYRESVAGVARLLDLELKEIPDWNCCGATAAHALNHELALSLCARNLHLAEKAGLDLLVPCALCFHELKASEKAILEQGWPGLPEYPFKGQITVWDLLSFLSREEWLARFKEKVVRPLAGLKAVCYYGCQVARPPRVTDHPNPENPREMEKIVAACGAEPLEWSYKTDCCGASLSVPRRDIMVKLVGDILDHALETGAQVIVVSCQMCQMNLDAYQAEISRARGRSYNIPVVYFTELMGLAAGLKEAPKWLGRHFVDPKAVLGAA